jgi:hypothetical protein
VVADLRSIYGSYLLPKVDSDAHNVRFTGHKVRVTRDDINRWNELTSGTTRSLLGEIGLYLAGGFHSSELPFWFCDAIANDLFVIMTHESPAEDWSDVLFEVYCAFDEGEYQHREKQDDDPVEVYTRPMVAQILAKFST